MVKQIHINAGAGYEVKIGSGLMAQAGSLIKDVLNAKRLAVFTDSTVDALYGDKVEKSLQEAGFETCRFVFPAGEESKRIETVSAFTDFMSEHSLTRSDAVVAVGGGVAGDMGGFAAAIYLRGIKFIQIPTTLLAAVDSSVGGKTGVDTAYGKNLVGAFWQPSLVLYDTDTFDSLSEDLILDGTAEIIKTAAIRDAELFKLVKSSPVQENLAEIVKTCVSIKGAVVDADEHDNGLRKILNFGHTMAHAIEKDAGYQISHGKAVAIGMLLITKASELWGRTKQGTYDELYNLITALGYQTKVNASLQKLCKLAGSDKKRSGDSISIVYLTEIGHADTLDINIAELYEQLKS